MSVARLDDTGDWTLGLGVGGYATRTDEISQNVVTRIRSFANDWFLDVGAEIDWFNILGNKNNEETILREVERVARATDGVLRVRNVSVVKFDSADRTVQIRIDYVDIYDQEVQREVGIIDGN